MTGTSFADWSGFTESGDVERTGRTASLPAVLLRAAVSLRMSHLGRLRVGLWTGQYG